MIAATYKYFEIEWTLFVVNKAFEWLLFSSNETAQNYTLRIESDKTKCWKTCTQTNTWIDRWKRKKKHAHKTMLTFDTLVSVFAHMVLSVCSLLLCEETGLSEFDKGCMS